MQTPRLGTKQLRKELAAVLNAEQPRAIGTPWNLRAFLIPVPQHDHWNQKARHTAIRQAMTNAQALAKAELQN